MNRYDVTLKALVSVRVAAVPGATQPQAIDAALDLVDLYSLFRREHPTPKVQFTEYGEEVPEALVDEVGDAEYERSCWFLWQDGQWIPASIEQPEAIQPSEQHPQAIRGEPDDNPGQHVILSVTGGVADLIFKPAGITVAIFDYDVEGDDDAARDPDGERCRVCEWPDADVVHQNAHWPIVRDAIAAGDLFTRRWKCPGCDRTVTVSYEDLAEAGSPICTDCDREMDML